MMPGKENIGYVMTALLGIAGPVIATYAGQMIGWYQAGPGTGWISSTISAFVVLWGYLRLKSKS